MPVIRLEKPNLSRIDERAVFEKFAKNRKNYLAFVEKVNSPEYFYWKEFKHKERPSGLSAEEFWVVTKLIRDARSSKTFIKDTSGEYFHWVKLNRFERFVNQIDMQAAGNLLIPEHQLLEIGKRKESYVVRGIIEEAIASSQLEGAHTTRAVAKKMLLEERKPRNHSEQMILNNYEAIQKIENEYQKKPLTREFLFELHRMLVKGTEVDDKEIGRFRTDGDGIVVGDARSGDIGHIPPKVSFMLPEIDRLLTVANDEDEGDFLHPLVKAILLHFWIGYLHPFTDGNGRLARAIFYWYLLRKGYWAIMYLPISTAIRNSPAQYKDAYLRSEQDDLDLTYFVDYNFRQVDRAIDYFRQYIAEKVDERKIINERLGVEEALNGRQRHLLYHLSANKGGSTTIITHQKINGISRLTARKDLYTLVRIGFLNRKKVGKVIHFMPTEKTVSIFRG
ncbi:MAG: Fic family protein [Patescibacteria group bacterium]